MYLFYTVLLLATILKFIVSQNVFLQALKFRAFEMMHL